MRCANLDGRSPARQRGIYVVVDASSGEHAVRAPFVDGHPRLGRQLRPSPTFDVVLERALVTVVGRRAMLQRDPAAVREEPLVERPQTVGSPVYGPGAPRLARVAV